MQEREKDAFVKRARCADPADGHAANQAVNVSRGARFLLSAPGPLNTLAPSFIMPASMISEKEIEEHKDKLRKAIANKDVTAVIGGGVSIAATREARNWVELIKDGLAKTNLSETLQAQLRALIESKETDLDVMLPVADIIRKKLLSANKWQGWIRDSFRGLRVVNKGVLESLGRLGIPLTTTNYDDLLREGTGRTPVLLSNKSEAARFVHESSVRLSHILHLHGHWTEDKSIVFGINDYQQLLLNEYSMGVLRSTFLTNTLLFVGCGDTMDDPNLGALLRWVSSVSTETGYCHYQLVRRKDMDKADNYDCIRKIPYGEEFDDLAPFLAELAPSRLHANDWSELPFTAYGPKDNELARLARLIESDSPGFIVVHGQPGAGKDVFVRTALGDEAIKKKYGGRIFPINCQEITSWRDLLYELRHKILPSPLQTVTEELIANHAAENPAIVVLRECNRLQEHDLVALENGLARLGRIPSLKLILTYQGGVARRPLCPANRIFEVKPLSDESAREMLLEIAGAHFSKHENLLASALRRSRNLPGHICLIGAALYDLGADAAAEENFTRALEKIEATEEMHYWYEFLLKSLSPTAKLLLACISALSGSVSCEDAACLISEADDGAARSELERLRLAQEVTGRLEITSALQTLIRRKIQAGAITIPPAKMQAMLRLFLNKAPRVADVRSETVAGYADELRNDLSNIETAVKKAFADPDLQPLAAECALALGKLKEDSGFGASTVTLLGEAKRFAEQRKDYPFAAACARHKGGIAFLQSEYKEARKAYTEAGKLAASGQDRLGKAHADLNLAAIEFELSNYDAAEKHLAAAEVDYGSADDAKAEIGRANCLLIRARIDLARLRLDRAYQDHRRTMQLPADNAGGQFSAETTVLPTLRAATELYRKHGRDIGVASALALEAEAEIVEKRLPDAKKHYIQAFGDCQRLGHRFGQANCLFGQGQVAQREGRRDIAKDFYERAAKEFMKIGAQRGQANCLNRFGDLARSNDDFEEASNQYQAALEKYEQIGDACAVGWMHWTLAQIDRQTLRGGSHVAEALAKWRECGREDLVTLHEQLLEKASAVPPRPPSARNAAPVATPKQSRKRAFPPRRTRPAK